jgi:hypothetical protein
MVSLLLLRVRPKSATLPVDQAVLFAADRSVIVQRYRFNRTDRKDRQAGVRMRGYDLDKLPPGVCLSTNADATPPSGSLSVPRMTDTGRDGSGRAARTS